MARGRDEDRLEETLRCIEALREEVRALRSSQQRLMKATVTNHHEVVHRLVSTRDMMQALVTASHTELLEHIEALNTSIDTQRQQLDTLERDVDLLFDGEHS